MCSIIFLHFLAKKHSIYIRHCFFGIYFYSSRCSCVHGHYISWNGSHQSILLCICWKYMSQVGSGALAWLAILWVFFMNWRLYCQLLLRCGLLHCCFLGITFQHWQFCLLLWLRELSLVVRPWSDGEMNIVDGSCCSEWTKTNLFPFANLYMVCQ